MACAESLARTGVMICVVPAAVQSVTNGGCHAAVAAAASCSLTVSVTERKRMERLKHFVGQLQINKKLMLKQVHTNGHIFYWHVCFVFS